MRTDVSMQSVRASCCERLTAKRLLQETKLVLGTGGTAKTEHRLARTVPQHLPNKRQTKIYRTTYHQTAETVTEKYCMQGRYQFDGQFTESNQPQRLLTAAD